MPGRPPCGGSDSTATGQSEERGERGKKDRLRRAGRGDDTAERGPATTARAAETGPSRKGVLTRDRETARASDRSGHARQNRRESHCTTPLSSPTTPAAPSRPETRRPPGSPRRRHRHERETDADTPMPTDEDPRAAVGPHVRRRAGRGQQPFSHRTVPSPRARSINARHGPSRPRGGEGGLPRFRQPWERCRGKGGARRHNHTAREAHSTHHARRRPASRERPKSWTRARGTHATEGTGDAREDGWGPGSPPSPTHTPSRTAALRRGGKYRARGGVHGALSPATTTQPEPHGSAATAGRQTGSAPRDPSPNSERGGAGRGRRESKRCASGRRSGGEPSRGPFGRDPSRP